MSDNNNSNGEIRENEANYRGADYGENQFAANNPDNRPTANYGGAPVRNFYAGNRIPRENRWNNAPMPPPQYNTANRGEYADPNNRVNYDQYPMNNRGGNRMNNAGNYRGDDRMNYPGNYRTDGRMNYPNGYRGEDNYGYDYDYDCPHPYYHPDYDCDYYEGRRPYYRGYRPYRRARAAAPYPNMQGCDPYYNQEMMPSSWWNPNMVREFINRPRVNDFLRGVGIATVGLILAPSVTRTLRPIVVKAVQGAMAASDEVKNIFVDAKEDMEDIFAEAKWQGEGNERYQHGEGDKHNE